MKNWMVLALVAIPSIAFAQESLRASLQDLCKASGTMAHAMLNDLVQANATSAAMQRELAVAQGQTVSLQEENGVLRWHIIMPSSDFWR